MIIVLGSIEVDQQHIDAAIQLSLEHVRRSRREPGCISHSVQVDAENSGRLVFFEQWQDMNALQVHFKVAESGEFVNAIKALSISDPVMEFFDSTPVG